jgi:hypothetical protein
MKFGRSNDSLKLEKVSDLLKFGKLVKEEAKNYAEK